jgi:CheY-like chemotaxis protein
MDGIEAIINIRNFEISQFGSYRAVIIAMTACLLDTEYDQAIKSGCNDFLIKPLALGSVMKKIKDWGNVQASLAFEE